MHRFFGISLALSGLALAALALVFGASWSGLAYAAGVIVIGGSLAARGAVARRRLAAGLGAAILLATFTVRAQAPKARASLVVGPAGDSPLQPLGRLVDEGDAATLAATTLVASGRLPDPEAKLVPAAMRDAYRRMREAEGDMPSPVLATYTRGQSPSAFDILVLDGIARPRGAVIFLHGFGGGFALPCWLMANAARAADLVTFCPSTGPMGDWWSRDGEETVRRTIALARARGLDRIILAGLSNGGIGASRLAPRLRGQIQGLVLVSGAAPEAARSGVPTLVVHGAGDSMCPAGQARAYATRNGARWVQLGGAHFGMLTHEEDYRSAMADWLVATTR